MEKKQIIGLVVAAVLFVGVGASNVLVNSVSNQMEMDAAAELEAMFGDFMNPYNIAPPMNEYIGVVSVQGTIMEQVDTTGFLATEVQGYKHDTSLEFIDIMMNDGYNAGILLYVDSPGGAVYESEELYHKIREYQEVTGKPVWTYMAHYGASGGYYVSAPSDQIYANINTTTGSIGVIISGYDMTGLYEKLGINQFNIVSDENKNSSQLSEEQIAIYQSVVDETYERFVDVVAEGRGMSEDEVRTLADGRIYTATQAKENGLIDEIATYDEMTAIMCDELGVYNFYEPQANTSLLGVSLATVESLIPKSEAEILLELESQLGNGVPMYYVQ